MDFLFSIGDGIGALFSLVPWILGGGAIVSIIGLLLVWFFAPHLAPIIGKTAGPILELATDLFVKFTRAIVAGLTDIFDDTRTILTFVVALALVAGFYSYKHENKFQNPTAKQCKPVIDELRKDYKFIKRK